MSFDNSLYGLNNSNNSQQSITIARVTDIILDRIDITDPKFSDFSELGEWGAIGCINFSILYSNKSDSSNKFSNLIARPLFSNIKTYPLKGEIVQIITGPSDLLNEQKNKKEYYYLPQYNTWNSVHHNAFPDIRDYAEFITENKFKYNQVSEGNTQGNDVSYQEYPLGNTFKEKDNIKNLLPFEGDIIIEGRWGQSIRFGSTVVDKQISNSWSSGGGQDGDPILIIRNNQGNQQIKEGYVPTVEDINVDGSSIYMTSNQSINIQNLFKFPLDTFGVKISLSSSKVIQPQLPPKIYDTTSPSNQDNKELLQAKNSDNINNA
jgi:hypothetical protein